MKKLKFTSNPAIQLTYKMMEEERQIISYGSVDFYEVNNVMRSMRYLFALNTKPVTLVIQSYGGSVDAGLALYDFIKASKVQIHTEVQGVAASMAAVLLAAGHKGKRVARKNSRIMIHQPSSGFIGKSTDIEDHAKETTRVRNLLNKLLSNDTGQKLDKVSKDTLRDHWMTAEEALKYGIVDKIV